jgi:methyl-accepting chemotaxis protein
LIASSSASSTGAVVVACAATLVVVVLLGAALSLRRSARQLRSLAEELADHAATVIGEAEDTIARARGELDRVDDLIGSAEAISDTVESATRLAHTALATPLIKVMAFGAGTARAGKRLRKAG